MGKYSQQNKTTKFNKIYVDAIGRKWYFHGTAKNGEELTELLKTNWLNKCSYYKTKSSARYLCSKSPKCRNGCKFKGIYRKKTGTFYIRNKHNHPVFEITDAPKGNDDFVDQYKNHWRFLANANNKGDLAALLKKNWLSTSTKCKNKNFYVCRRSIIRKRFVEERCGFRALFLKANSGLYTIGEHNHGLREGETPKDEEDYVDNLGTNWPFFTRIKDRAHLEKIVEQNYLKIICQQTKSTIKATCHYSMMNWGKKQHDDCPMRATFLKSNSTLYLRGEHNHEIQKRETPKGTEDFVDIFGTNWPFFAHINDNAHLKEIAEQNRLLIANENPCTIKLRCCRHLPKQSNCPVRATFLKSNSTLYLRGEHNHSHAEGGPPKDEDDYVDNFGKSWPFLAHIKDSTQLNKIIEQNCLKIYRRALTTIKAKCIYCTKYYGKQQSKNLHCPVRATFLKCNSTLYLRGKHNHELDGEHMQSSKKSIKMKFQQMAANTQTIYVDGTGTNWHFHGIANNAEELTKLLANNWLLKDQERQNTIDHKCRKHKNGCKFKGIFLKESCKLYTKNEHNHPFVINGGTPKGTDDYVDICGKSWPFFARINNETHLNGIAEQNCLKIFQTKNKSSIKAACRYSKLNRWYFKKHCDCPVRATFLKSNSTLYLRGEHNHELDQNKKKTLKKSKHNEAESNSEEEEEDEVSSKSEEEEDEDELTTTDSEEEENVEDREGSEDEEISDQSEEENSNESGMEDSDSDDGMDEEQEGNNVEIPAAIVPPPDLELEIVDEVNRQEYKRLPPMKRECDTINAGPKQWPTVTIESEVSGWQWQQTRSQKEAMLRPMKKEEPADEQPEEPLPNEPTTSNANPNQNVGPHKIYLRARKPVNYAENRFGK